SLRQTRQGRAAARQSAALIIMSKLARLLLCLGLTTLAGCGGSSDQFYRLEATSAAAVTGSSGLSVAVGPVALPGYIDRPEIVFQNGPNEFQIPPHARWIGSLQENIARVLASDLGRALHSGRVHPLTGGSGATQYRVAIDIRQFHGISGDEAILDLSWKIQDASGHETYSRHNGNFHERIIGDGYEPLVAAQSRLLAQAAQAIAASLRGR
ncbi:MAG: PqiC family protein, partial [Verrucomicrobiota bacterium]|nr:PqiC family protein [Verrucomicrobiota bacterium]